MGSFKYSTNGYGYGYWNEYGVTSQAEEAFESTSYQVFPPQEYTDSLPWGNWDQTDLHSELMNAHDSTQKEGEDSEIGRVLEFLDDLYHESRELFKAVASDLGKKYLSKNFNNKEDEEKGRAKAIEKFLEKVPRKLQHKKLDEMKVQTMRRSLSLGSPRSPPLVVSGEESTSKLQRFKVKTLDLGGGGGVAGAGAGAGGGVKQDGQGTTNYQ